MKLVVFDMDGTLLNGRVIFSAAAKWGFEKKLLGIMKSSTVEYIQTEEIAKLLKGIPVEDFITLVKEIPLTPGSEETTRELKNMGWKLGIMSDSYTLATINLVKKLEMDFQVANELEERNGVLTGRVTMPLGWTNSDCECKRSVCKSSYLEHYAKLYAIPISETIAIGDNTSDICVLRKAGFSIAFNPKNEIVNKVSDVTINKLDMREILKYIR